MLVLAHGLWYGGAQVSTLELLSLLKDRRRSIDVAVCEDADRDFLGGLQSLGLSVTEVPYRMVQGYPQMAPEPLADLVADADLVWITDIEYLAAPHIKRAKRVPIVAHVRSYSLICPWWGNSYGLKETDLEPCSAVRFARCKQLINGELRKIGILSPQRSAMYKLADVFKGPIDFFYWPLRNKHVIDDIDGFIFVSNAMKRIHEKHVPEIGSKLCDVVYNVPGVSDHIVERSVKGFFGHEDQPGITFADAGGGQPIKGAHVLLQALRILTAEGHNVRVNLVGCKGTWIGAYVDNCNLTNNVSMSAKLPKKELLDLMTHSSIVVVPSIWPEPFGRVALESNYLGIPVVASKIGGLPEIVIDNNTGFLAEPGSPRDLADKIVKALRTGFQRASVHEVTAQRFDPVRLVDRLDDFFDRF